MKKNNSIIFFLFIGCFLFSFNNNVFAQKINCKLCNLKPCNVFYTGEPIKLGLIIVGLPEKEKFIISYSVKNYWGKKIEAKEETHEYSTKILKLAILENIKTSGFFSINLKIKYKDICINKIASVCIFGRPPAKDENFAWGVWMGHLLDGGYPDEELKALRRLGVDWLQFAVEWRQMEPEKNKFVWVLDDEIKKIKNEYGFNIHAMPRLPPQWAIDTAPGKKIILGKNLPSNPDDLADFIFHIVNHYKNYIKVWSPLGDEPEDRAKGNEDKFLKLVKVSYSAAKKADSKCIVIGGETSESSEKRPFVHMLYQKAKDFFDVFGFHPYAPARILGSGYVESPDDYELEKIIKYFQQLSKKYTKGKIPVWPTVIGWKIENALIGKLDDAVYRQQASFLVQSFSIARACGCKGISWFICREGKGGGYDIIFRQENVMQTTPAFMAYSTLLRLLKNVEKGEIISLGEAAKACVFSKGQGTVAVLWAKKPGAIEFKNKEVVEEVNIVGVKQNLYCDKIRVRINSEPIFLLFPKTNFSKVTEELKSVKLSGNPMSVSLSQEKITALNIQLINNTDKKQKGVLKVISPALGISTEKRIDVNGENTKNNTVNYCYSIVNTEPLLKKGAEVITVFENKWNTYENHFLLKYTPVHYKKEIRIDGNLNDWDGIAPIILNTASDALIAKKWWTGPDDLSVNFYIAYNNEFLYLGVKVKDESLMQKYTGRNIWKNDCLHIALKINSNISRLIDYEYGFALTSKGIQNYCWLSPNGEKGYLSAINTMVKREKGVTFYEIAIPQKEIEPLKLKAGNIFGFNFAVMDSDKDSDANYYWLSLTPGLAGGKNADLFQKFVFIK